ncbi:MAG TPA: phage holin family protein [Cyclobacteriaceae bacterium]|nr:phage holin family protein [Cyclobacteriaceae bacterium]
MEMLKDRLLKFLKLDGLIDSLSDYFETRVEILKIEIKEDVIRLIAQILVGLVIGVAALFFLLLISFAVAYSIADRLGTPLGFIIVAGFYLILAILFLLFKKDISAKLEKILSEIIKKKES